MTRRRLSGPRLVAGLGAVLAAAALATVPAATAGAAGQRPGPATQAVDTHAGTVRATPRCGAERQALVLFSTWLRAVGHAPSTTGRPAGACPDSSLILHAAATPTIPVTATGAASAVAAPGVVVALGGPASPAVGCDAALSYLRAHAAPDYELVCPGYAQGHEGMTCDHWASICPGVKEIVIADPCPVAYMNEASNSLVFDHLTTAPIDPYGYACPA